MPRPQDARAAAGAREALAAAVDVYRVVAVVSGRRSEELVELLGVEGLHHVGLYGMQESAPDLVEAVAARVEAAAARVPAAWVEHKAASIAVHYRQAPDPTEARAWLLPGLREIAAAAGLAVLEGKMVIELVPAAQPRKGGAVERLIGEHALEAALFAGDDLADLEAFQALRRAAAGGAFVGVAVAVRGVETPEALVEAADLVVEGPAGLVALLRQLV